MGSMGSGYCYGGANRQPPMKMNGRPALNFQERKALRKRSFAST